MKKAMLARALVFAALLFNLSCADSGSSNKSTGNGGPGPNPQEATKDTTRTEVCQGNVPMGTAVFQTWRSDSETSSGLSFTNYMKVEPNAIEVQVICRDRYNRASVTVRANASVTMDSIRTLSNDQDEVTVQSGNNKLTCRAAITSGIQISYSFQGPCLKGHVNGEAQLMVPAF